VKKAIQFLRDEQEEDGSWYRAVGREFYLWHLAGSAWHARLWRQHDQPWLLRARDWLESVQHEDGGWGERCILTMIRW